MDSTPKKSKPQAASKAVTRNGKQETEEPTADTGSSLVSSIIVEPAKLIGWLGASVGGLTILVLIIGFLALSAHDAMLGIPRTIEDKSEYIVIGSLFFSRSIIFLLGSLLDNRACWILLGMVIVAGVALSLARRTRAGKHLIRLAMVGLIGAEIFALFRLIAPLQFENVLLHTPAATDPQILKWIACSNWIALQSEYGFLVLLVTIIAVTLRRLESHYQKRSDSAKGSNSLVWSRLRVPALVLLLILVVLLPRAYGVLTLSNDYPVGNLISSDPAVKGETVFLLRQDEKLLVTYEWGTNLISWRKRDDFQRIEISTYKHAPKCYP